MKILLVHNYYQQAGGEDQVFKEEFNLLQKYGHEVFTYRVNNDDINRLGKIRTSLYSIWNKDTYRKFTDLIDNINPDIVHFHNTFPLISPSGYWAVNAKGKTVIQTLHNYRLLCLNALLFNKGGICEDCISKNLRLKGVFQQCYRDSFMASSVVAVMQFIHGLMQTWTQKVDTYIALTEFARTKFIAGGLPSERIEVKPNFIYPVPVAGTHGGGYALFVGRLSVEKGIDTLVTAWRTLNPRYSLKIVGDGPLVEKVKINPGIEYLGRKEPNEVLELLGDASLLIFPSECYEGLPKTIIEAFATGTPVIASNLGSMATLVNHGQTGLHFTPGDPDGLAAKVEWAFNNPDEMRRMGLNARREYEEKYTAQQNYKMLMNIYNRAIERSKVKI
ncbi:MAG: glycosyl transferase family 1 [Firmicutes bacterium HGW-Firmicutes-14]|nr:MAG: glycosyl transferase family 1 [Firmicutes bacterium HGW-Firmicutes-14]